MTPEHMTHLDHVRVHRAEMLRKADKRRLMRETLGINDTRRAHSALLATLGYHLVRVGTRLVLRYGSSPGPAYPTPSLKHL